MNGIPSGQGLWFTFALIAIVVVRFLLRELRERRIALARIFVLPGVFALLVLFLAYTTLSESPEQLVPLLIGSVAALFAGSAVGLAVAHFTTVRPSPTAGAVLVRGSPATVAIWLVALLLRLVPRFILGSTPHASGTTLMLNAVLLVMLAVAIFVVRLQVFRRARALSETVGQSR